MAIPDFLLAKRRTRTTEERLRSEFDVIVVGGGPAGSSAARTLAQAGLDALVLEKSAMPRRKVCGGGVSAQALSYLDFEIPPELIDRECRGARVSFDGRTVEARLAERVAVLSTRARFDQYLLDRAREAGAEVRYELVREVRSAETCVEVVTAAGEYHARAVVVAAGAGNQLSGIVRRRDREDEYAVTLEAEIPVESPDRLEPFADMVDIELGVTPFGYGWVFHHRDHYSVGVGGLRSRVRNPHRPMEEFLASRGFSRTPAGLKGHPIPCGGIRRQVVRGRVLLAGDAGGFVDPFNGEGIAYAIRSGQLAGEAVIACAAAGWDTARLRDYQQRSWRELGLDLRWSRWMSKVVYSYPRFFLGLFVRNRRLSEKYLQVPLNRLTYSQFVKWMVPRVPLLWVEALLTDQAAADGASG